MTYCHAILQVVAQMLIVLVLLLKKWMRGKRNASVMSSVKSWITNYQFHRLFGHQISMRLEYNISFKIFVWSILHSFLQTLAMESYGFETTSSTKMSISSNLLKVQVFFTSLSVETVTESATYEANMQTFAYIFKILKIFLLVGWWVIHVVIGRCHISLAWHLPCNGFWGCRALHWLYHKFLQAISKQESQWHKY